MSDVEKAVHAAVEKWRKERMPEYISTTDQMRLEAHLRAALSALGGGRDLNEEMMDCFQRGTVSAQPRKAPRDDE